MVNNSLSGIFLGQLAYVFASDIKMTATLLNILKPYEVCVNHLNNNNKHFLNFWDEKNNETNHQFFLTTVGWITDGFGNSVL